MFCICWCDDSLILWVSIHNSSLRLGRDYGFGLMLKIIFQAPICVKDVLGKLINAFISAPILDPSSVWQIKPEDLNACFFLLKFNTSFLKNMLLKHNSKAWKHVLLHFLFHNSTVSSERSGGTQKQLRTAQYSTFPTFSPLTTHYFSI